LNRALSLAGFESTRFRYFDSLGFPAALAVRFLEKLGLFRYSSKSVGLYDRYVFPISRAVDRVAWGLIGKNLIAVARAPRMSETPAPAARSHDRISNL